MKAFILALLLMFGVSAAAQNSIVKAITANTPTNILEGRYLIQEIVFANGSTTNAATINVYDWHTSETNVVRAAYTSYIDYATNYTVIHTNQAGLLSTNIFAGWAYIAQENAAVTNEQTIKRQMQVPANTIGENDTPILVLRGFTLLSTESGTATITYRNRQ